MKAKGIAKRLNVETSAGRHVPERKNPTFPMFFVSVASKGLSLAVSLLFATPAGRSISVAAKGVREEEARKE
jgi:hypothetical protein